MANSTDEIFTDKISGAAFWEKANAGFEIKEMKNGKLFYISNSTEYPKGYISDEAQAILRTQKELDPSADGKRKAICMLTFANIHADDGSVIPALIKTPEAPKTFW